MAVRDSRELVIEATADEIMAVIKDIESLPEWSDIHLASEVLERDEEGRAVRAKMKVKSVGITDEQIVNLTWHADGVSWTLESAKQLRAQDARYTLTPEGNKTRVKFVLTTDPLIPMPGFVLRQIAKKVMSMASDGLRKRVLSQKKAR